MIASEPALATGADCNVKTMVFVAVLLHGLALVALSVNVTDPTL